MNKINKFTALSGNVNKILSSRFSNIDKQYFSDEKINLSVLSKLDNEYYTIRPLGKKCFLWFTYFDTDKICVIKFNNIDTFYKCNIEFDNTLSYNNVLLYGYLSTIDKNNYFIIDNVINYNNYNYVIFKNKSSRNFIDILKISKIIFDNLYNKNFKSYKCDLYIRLPFITDSYNDVFNNIYNIYYTPYSINVYNKTRNVGTYVLNNKDNIKTVEAIFKIKADLGHDLYNLYCIDNKELVFYNKALINTYKLSVYMNNIFRNIVENRNLDLLEESEDEETFENIEDDKFIHTDKCLSFICIYNKKFKKWIPKRLLQETPNNSNDSNKINTKRELFLLEKK